MMFSTVGSRVNRCKTIDTFSQLISYVCKRLGARVTSKTNHTNILIFLKAAAPLVGSYLTMIVLEEHVYHGPELNGMIRTNHFFRPW